MGQNCPVLRQIAGRRGGAAVALAVARINVYRLLAMTAPPEDDVPALASDEALAAVAQEAVFGAPTEEGIDVPPGGWPPEAFGAAGGAEGAGGGAPEAAKHVVIAHQLREAIRSRAFPVGTEIPSESSLAHQFGASRGTVRQALSTLKQEGLIHTMRGRKPVVQAQPLAQSIDDFFSFSSWAYASGRVPGQRTIEISRRRRQSPEPQVPLAYPTGEVLVYLTRLRLIDGEPTMIERTVFQDDIGRELLRFDTDSGSIYEYLLAQGAPLDEGTHLVDAVPANILDAELLLVPVGTPLLRVRRHTVSAAGKVLEYSEDRYRSDRASIRIRNSRATASGLTRASRTSPAPESDPA